MLENTYSLIVPHLWTILSFSKACAWN